MKKICFVFSGVELWFTSKELVEILKSVTSFIKQNHKKEIEGLLQNWSQIISIKGTFFSFYNDEAYYKVKELLFFYHVRDRMVESGVWIPIDKPNLNTDEVNELKRRAKKYGDYRYSVDNGWLGVLAQDLFAEFLKQKGIAFEEFDENSSVSIDDYDLTIGRFKIDVKCATQLNYMEITPKVLVEFQKKKDFYVALKYFSDVRKFFIIGYFLHNELNNYPFKALYGTPFWGVKLYNAKPISELFLLVGNE